MTLSKKTRSRIERYFADKLSREEALLLSKEIREHQAIAQAFVNYGCDETLLIEVLREEDLALSRGNAQAVAFPDYSKRRHFLAGAIIAMALVIAAIFALKKEAQPEVYPGFAKIDAVAGQIAEEQMESGLRLDRGDAFSLTSGVVSIQFDHGSRLTLEAPVDVEFLGEREMRLNRGRLTANISTEAKGFSVKTEAAEVIDLSTAFGMNVSESGELEVLVIDGEVAITAPEIDGGPRTRRILRSGNAMKIPSGGKAAGKEMAFRPALYEKNWPMLWGIASTEGALRFVNVSNVTKIHNITDRRNIIVIPEQMGVELDKPLTIAMDRVEGDKTIEAPPLTIEAGQRVNSFLCRLHLERKRSIAVSGKITFRQPIIGVIFGHENFLKTDELLGNKNIEYNRDLNKGLRLEPNDHFAISKDRMSLEINFLGRNGTDEIRVIVDASASPIRN